LESAAADLVSKPTTRLSMGTKIPPPPTPPTVPNAEPRNPTTVATTTRQLNARSWERERERENTTPIRKVSPASGTRTQSEHTKHAQERRQKSEQLTGQTRGEREDRRRRAPSLRDADAGGCGSAAERTKQARTAAQVAPAAT
jgi:hypothetical protein